MSNKGKDRKKNLPHGIHIMEPNNPSGSEASEALEPSSSELGKARLGINGKENPEEIPHPGAISSSNTWQPRTS